MTKKVLLIFTFLVMSITIYSNNYCNENLNSNVIEPKISNDFDSVFIKSIINPILNKQLEVDFIKFFDEVNNIEVLYSGELNAYYYKVFGKKNGEESTQLLMVNSEDIENETYTFIDFSNFKGNKNHIEFCYYGSECLCTNNPIGRTCTIICGLWDGFNCTF